MSATPRSAFMILLAAGIAVLGSLAHAAPPQMTRDDIICRAASGVGFSYYWGGACWCANGCQPNTSCSSGSCSGNCPSCSHSGTYGADCSGFTTKVWQVPNPIATTTCGHGPYVASTYTGSTSYWNTISRSSLLRGDALASSTHVYIYEQGDPWGSHVAYEARGCSYGIVRNWRTASSSYSAARRINIGPTCACTPGATQSEGCGNCGTRSRTCQSNCAWGGWSNCTGQGTCSPGTTEERDCCDCGAQTRSCNNQCAWRNWSACEGPDPASGSTACDTTEPGPCAEGRVRCVDGCQTCVRSYEPIAELCDAIDNDCSGEVDDGSPAEMGATPPPWAATLVDGSFPSAVQPGERATVWASFRNEGARTWQTGDVWLAADYGDGATSSDLYDRETWPAFDVAATLDHEVRPGETARFVWSIKAPATPGKSASQLFRLMDPDGAWLRCPTPTFSIALRTTSLSPRDEASPASDAPSVVAQTPADSGCACALAPRTDRSAVRSLAALLLAILAIARQRRRRRRGIMEGHD